MSRSGARAGGRRLPWVPLAFAIPVLLLGLGRLGIELRESAAERAAFPTVDGRLSVSGLESPVEIRRGPRGVPHVEAASELDAFFGLGFVHAQDRLAQMLWMSRRGRGRAAEVLGPPALPGDRLARVLGLERAAEAAWEALDADTRRILEAYADGVNARIERLRSERVALPRSLAREDVPLQAWTPLDSLVVFKLYAWGLSDSLDSSLVLLDLIERLGGFRARRFFPQLPVLEFSPPPDAMPATAASRPWVGEGAGASGGARGMVEPVRDPLRRAIGMAGRSTGSSAWVVGGAHTSSGLPVLAADSHLEPTAPPLLHFDHLRGGGLDVAGTTLPGVPAFWTGRNLHVAWASTRAGVSTSDLYVETLDPRAQDRYHDGRGWKPLDVREETIHVRGGEDRVLVVRATRHGPLVNDLLAESREPLALAWVGRNVPDARGIASLLEVARAHDAAELRTALSRHHEPALAVAYADASGAAGVQLAGWIPARVIPSGLVPLPGRASYYDWRGPIPFERLPHEDLRRGRGWVIAADNRIPGGEAPMDWLWRSGARAARIEQLLRAAVRRGPIDVRGLARLQTDVGTDRGPRLVAAALALAGDRDELSAEAREVAALLAEWDGRATATSVGAAAYHVFLEDLTGRLMSDALGPELLARYLGLAQAEPEEVVFGIVADAASGAEPDSWSDPGRVSAAVRQSLREAWFRLSFQLGANRVKWRWGRLHPLRFRPLSPLDGAPASGLGPFDYGGSSSTPNAAEYDASAPFAVRVASMARFAVDTSELDQVLISLAPGQSEHPAHPHYSDGLGSWLEGRPALLTTSRLMVEEESVSRLQLVPAP